MVKLGKEKELRAVNNGSLWNAIKRYNSKQISVKALSEFGDVVMGMSNYNVYDLLELWDKYHNMYNVKY